MLFYFFYLFYLFFFKINYWQIAETETILIFLIITLYFEIFQAPTQSMARAPTLASYVIVLKDLEEKIDNILDIQFLHGYYEPTLLLLYEPVRTFAG